MSYHHLLDFLFRQPTPAAPILTSAGWWRRHVDTATVFSSPGELAMAMGFLSDRLGYAFASGYQCALHAALLCQGAPRLRSLAVTEARGNTPRVIESEVHRAGEQLRVTGEKRFATLADVAADLLVVARIGEVAGRPRLAAVLLKPDDPGLSVLRTPDTAFTPEVRHARLRFDVRVPSARLLPGDGWETLVKPFGALEDALVRAATCGHLISAGRARGWPAAELDDLAATGLALAAFHDAGDLRAPAVWRALEATLRRFDAAVAVADARLAQAAKQQADTAAQRWRRDAPLLRVGQQRRAARIRRAHRQPAQPSAPSGPGA